MATVTVEHSDFPYVVYIQRTQNEALSMNKPTRPNWRTMTLRIIGEHVQRNDYYLEETSDHFVCVRVRTLGAATLLKIALSEH
jgi:hypothetical protein